MTSFPLANTYNAKIHYPLVYKTNSVEKNIFTDLNIYVTADESFEYKVVDFFPNKSEPKIFTNYNQVEDYISNSTFSNWDNQLKFAIYCATSGCGISLNNHLNNSNLFVRSIFRFHVYFTIRKILHFLEIPLPGDSAFNLKNNHFNKLNYEKLKLEFSSIEFNYFKTGKIHLLDMTMSGNHYLSNPHKFPFIADKHGYVDKDYTHLYIHSLNFVNLDDYTNFVLINSKGITAAGVQRINESIRTYVYCILGSQAMVRQKITDLASDAQKQFEILVEDAINGQTLVDSISTFQNASILIRSTQSLKHSLEQTKTQLNFAIGPNLQLLPSNMVLEIGSAIGYNNSLLTANANMKFGINSNVNLRVKRSIEDNKANETATKALTKAVETWLSPSAVMTSTSSTSRIGFTVRLVSILFLIFQIII